MIFGEVVLVAFPFTNQLGRKQRPAVVVSSAAYQQARPDVILIGITSQVPSAPGVGEVVLSDWQGAGLLKPSAIKPVLFTVERRWVVKTLGQLKDPDQQALRAALHAVLG
jgi:mRNA interferase MazF